MGHQLTDWTGNARGLIAEFGLKEAKSGALAVSIVAKIHECWDPEGERWIDYREGELEVSGDIWIVKKDGTTDQRKLESLIRYAGWDGQLPSVVEGTWQPTPCAFTVEREDYKDQARYRIGFINAYDWTPGAVGNVTSEKAKELQAKYGSQFRALAGNVKRATIPPTAPVSKPSVPKPAAKSQESPLHAPKPANGGPKPLDKMSQAEVNAEISGGEDPSIPF
jgi:hypothetical protein